MQRGYLLIQTQLARASHVRMSLDQIQGVRASTVEGPFDVIAAIDHPKAFRMALDVCRADRSVVRFLPCAPVAPVGLDERVSLDGASATVRRIQETQAVP